jgi:hypothetical protein
MFCGVCYGMLAGYWNVILICAEKATLGLLGFWIVRKIKKITAFARIKVRACPVG